jgi:pimeloyl-ACP methyl ester carboxylesterase
MDRRGRGRSGDGPIYAIEREYEDITAIIDSIGAPAHLLGHSFGANCALGAALLTRNIHKLILYEPGIPLPGVPLYQEGILDQIQALLEAGDREVVLTTYYPQVVGMSPQEIEQMRSSPAWSARLATTHTLLREDRALEAYMFDAQHFKNLSMPTLLLTGSDSPPAFKAATEAVNAALPNSRIVVLPGQQHLAMYTAPNLLVSELVQFLLGPL